MASGQGLRRAVNALAQETHLLNLHDELKDVTKSLEYLIKEREQATKVVIAWAERKEEPAVQDFMKGVCDVEIDMCGVDRRYNDHHRLFVKSWKGILSEKKELNARLAELKKVKSSLVALEKKAIMAEQKEPGKLDKRRQDVEEGKTKETNAQHYVDVKLLEVQQDKHQTLRNGYTALYTAQMDRMKELAELSERLRHLINAFPSVVSRGDDGTFCMAPFDGPTLESPIWWQGERLAEELKNIKRHHDHAVKKLKDEHQAKVDGMLAEQESMLRERSQSFNSEISTSAEQHQALLANLKKNHESKLAELEEKIKAAELAHAQAMHEATDRYQILQTDLAKRQEDLLEHMRDEQRLEETIRMLKNDAIARAAKQATATASFTGAAVESVCIDQLFVSAELVQNEGDALEEMSQSPDNFAEIDDKLADFARHFSIMVCSANGAARGSKAENSPELLGEAKAMGALGQSFLARWVNATEAPAAAAVADLATEADNTPAAAAEEAQPVEAKEPAKPMVRALYAHEGKVQEGFTLIGFAQGDVMELLHSRQDGWSKVKLSDDSEGWAPSSYLEEVPAPAAEPVAVSVPVVAVEESKADEAAVATAGAKAKTITASELHEAIEKMLLVARKVQRRDKELAALANAMVDDIGSKVSAAQQMILDALAQIGKLREEVQTRDIGRVLEVNTELLSAAEQMVKRMGEMIKSAQAMRASLMSMKGLSSTDEFNTKHSSWFEGLTNAMDTVAEGVPLEMEALRSVLRRKGKHEELQVSARSIAASVAQLSALSKTKTMGHGDKSQDLTSTLCDQIISDSHNLLSATRESQSLELASIVLEELDNLSAHEAKKLTMNTQVNVLKLEKELEREREKLGHLRRLNYD